MENGNGMKTPTTATSNLDAFDPLKGEKTQATAPWNPATLDPQLKGKEKETITNYADSESEGEKDLAARTKRDTFVKTPNMTRTPRGTDFRWADNTHITKKPFIVGQPQNMDLKLTDVNGTVWLFPPVDAAKDPNWDDPKWVAKANRWYDQVIIRRLDKAHPEDSTLRSMRPMWTIMEKAYLEMLIERRIRRIKDLLVADDWNAITKTFNERFEGTTVRIGLPVAHATIDNKDRPVKDLSLRRMVIKSPHILPARSMLSIRSQMYRWKDTRQMVEDLLAEYGQALVDDSENHEEEGDGEGEGHEDIMNLTGEPDGMDDDTRNQAFDDNGGEGSSGQNRMD